MMVKTSLVVDASPERAYDIYADYAGWPRLFPTISAVRVLKRTGRSVLLEVDHRSAGKVRNELHLQPKSQLELLENKPRYDARFVNRFEAVPEGSRIVVTGSAGRPIGESASTAARMVSSLSQRLVIGVRTSPGAMALMRMPVDA